MHWKGVRPENFGSVRTVLTSLLRRGPDFVSSDHGNGLQKLDLRDIKEKEKNLMIRYKVGTRSRSFPIFVLVS